MVYRCLFAVGWLQLQLQVLFDLLVHLLLHASNCLALRSPLPAACWHVVLFAHLGGPRGTRVTYWHLHAMCLGNAASPGICTADAVSHAQGAGREEGGRGLTAA